MAKIFESSRYKKPSHSAFDLSREQKLSLNMGEMIPTLIEEVLPSDNYKVNSEIMLRLAPMLAPVMHRVNVHMRYFFVPTRILWDEWEDFITGGKDGNLAPQPPVLSLNIDSQAQGLTDYMGLPTLNPGSSRFVSQLPFRAYQQIYNDYYRDPNLSDPVPFNQAVNEKAGPLTQLRNCSWEHDYFTSALPWSQRGPEVQVPIHTEYQEVSKAINSADDQPSYSSDSIRVDTLGNLRGELGEFLRIENIDLDDTGININDLRSSSAIQRFFERQAVGGHRLIETILSQFGKKSQDSRLQRAEYIGGGRQPVVISEVLNTTGTDEAPQGDMAGHGIAVGGKNRFTYDVPEHGYIMGIMTVLPKTGYQQGIHRMWSRMDKFDYYWPEFAHLGEQEIKNQELYVDPAKNTDPDDEKTFGYQQRYAEYKYGVNSVHGDFKSELDYWHMGRIFANRPQLNADFVTANPTHRIFNVVDPTIDTLWCQIYHNVRARRPMPFFSNPSLR